MYGKLGEGFIEVHHNKPLHTLEEEVIVDPNIDLNCVCSNCHSMLHKPEKVLTIQQLKKIINN